MRLLLFSDITSSHINHMTTGHITFGYCRGMSWSQTSQLHIFLLRQSNYLWNCDMIESYSCGYFIWNSWNPSKACFIQNGHLCKILCLLQVRKAKALIILCTYYMYIHLRRLSLLIQVDPFHLWWQKKKLGFVADLQIISWYLILKLQFSHCNKIEVSEWWPV